MEPVLGQKPPNNRLERAVQELEPIVESNTRQRPETELIRKAVAGDMSAYTRLVSDNRERVLRAAYGVLGSAEEAEDAAQDVFVKAWKKLDTYTGEASFSSWLYRITINTSIDVLRKRREQVALDHQIAEKTYGPEDRMLQSDTQRQIRQAVDALPDGSRSVIILREYEQLSYKEIAEILEIPIGTVMSRLNYARRRLRERLTAQGITPVESAS